MSGIIRLYFVFYSELSQLYQVSGLTNIIQDAVDVDDLIPYRMLRDRIDQYKDKVNKIVETSNENVHEVSEISAEQITFISSPSHPNNLEDDAGEEKNNEKDFNISLKSPTLSSVSSSPSLTLSPVNEANLGHSIPSLQSPRFTRQRHFSSSTAKFSSPCRGPSPHLSPVPRFLPRKAPLAEDFKGINHTPVPPLSHLQPHNDTLAQFQEAMKNMEEQKRARKLWQKHQQINNKKINTITHNPEELSPVRKWSKSQGDGLEGESRSSTPSPIRNCSAVSEGSFQLHDDFKKDNDEDGVKNSKHILCSGQIVQIPAAVAEIKKTKTSESREGSTLKKALDNMKFVEEERMRKLREYVVDHDSSSEPEETKLKKKKEKKKKRKKDKLEKAERKLRKLLKKKGLDKEVLAKILKKAKKKKSKKEEDMIELEDVSSPEPGTRELPPKPKISPIIERRVQHSGSEGKMQVMYSIHSS